MESRKPEILYLSYDGLTDILGQSQILPYVVGLQRKGYNYTIISFEKPAEFQASSSTILRQCSDEGIDWRPQVYHKRPPVLSTLYDLFVLKRIAKEIIRKKNVKIVHCRSYLAAIIGLSLKRSTGVKLIFDMRGFWADERVEGRLWSLDSMLYRRIYKYFKRKERQLIQHADHVIVLTQAAKDEIAGWNLTNSIEIVPCCVDLAVFDPGAVTAVEKRQLRSELGIKEDDFVLLYLGSLGTWYMTDEMLAFYRRLRAAKPNCKFLLVTRDVDAVNDEELIFRSAQRKDVPKYIAIADASICFIRPTFSKKGSSATKMAEVLAMNVPIITNNGWGDVAFLESRVNGLILADEGGNVPGAIFQSVPAGQTDFFYQYFGLEEGISRYDGVYRSLIGRG
jgi:glycosyltransferase involved in cell wall biosynthesis